MDGHTMGRGIQPVISTFLKGSSMKPRGDRAYFRYPLGLAVLGGEGGRRLKRAKGGWPQATALCLTNNYLNSYVEGRK